jgi:hypothetical protein
MSAFTDTIEELLTGAFGTKEQKREVWDTALKLYATPGRMGEIVKSHYVAWVKGYRYLVTVPPVDAGLPETVIVSDVELARLEGLTNQKAIQKMQEIRYDASQKRIDSCVNCLRYGNPKDAICFVCSREEWRRANELADTRYQEA